MADEETRVTGVGGPEAAAPEQAPPNVVKDNTGQIPVQPIATTDPTLDDNTNPKIPFDGSDPRNIPPHDSNEQLHIAAGKRMGAEASSMTDEDTRRRAVEAAYDNSQDVREVVGDVEAPEPVTSNDAAALARRSAAAKAGARTQPPQGRSNVDPKRAKA